jgi:hypothetical protein
MPLDGAVLGEHVDEFFAATSFSVIPGTPAGRPGEPGPG